MESNSGKKLKKCPHCGLIAEHWPGCPAWGITLYEEVQDGVVKDVHNQCDSGEPNDHRQ